MDMQYENVQQHFKNLKEKGNDYYLLKNAVNNTDNTDITDKNYINALISRFAAFKKAANHYQGTYNTMLNDLNKELATANEHQDLLHLLEHLKAKLSLAQLKEELAKETVYVQEYIIQLDKINLQEAIDTEIIDKREKKLNEDLENKERFIEEEKVAAEEVLVAAEKVAATEVLVAAEKAAAAQGGGKRKSKGKSKKVAKKPVVSQKKQSIYKEIFGKQMKIYKMPDSRKEYVKYKGELIHISDYKDLMKQKAMVKTKTKATKVTKATQQKAKSKTKK